MEVDIRILAKRLGAVFGASFLTYGLAGCVAPTLPIPARVASVAHESIATGTGKIVEFPVGSELLIQPVAVAAGWDDRMWFAPVSTYIGSITTAGVTASYRLPGLTRPTVTHPLSIVLGPDNNIWFTNGYGSQVGKVDHRGHVTLYTPTTPYGSLWTEQIINGPHHHLWLVETGAFYGEVDELDTNGRIVRSIALNTQYYCYPESIAEGAGNTLWVGNSSNCPKVQRVTLDGTVTDFPISSANGVQAVGSDGARNVWFTAGFGITRPYAFVGRISPNGKMRMFPISQPTTTADPVAGAIVLGPDGNMWFTQPYVGQIGNITPQGKVTVYPVPDAVYGSSWIQVSGITLGPDGNMWFGVPSRNRVGEFKLSPSSNSARQR